MMIVNERPLLARSGHSATDTSLLAYQLTQRIARNFLERRISLDPLPFGCHRWQNRYLARATSQRLRLRLAIALG